MRYITQKCLLVAILLCCASAAQALPTTDPNFLKPDYTAKWQVLETPHFRINYEPQYQSYAQRMAAIAERVHQRLSTWLKWQPQDKTEVVILDSVDFSNGAATAIPYNQFYIYLPTPVEGELLDQLPWLELVFTHEYVHVLQFDMVVDGPEVLRKLFGRVSNSLFSFMFFPQIFAPSWVSEGLAVYGESNFPKGYGRLNSATYAAMMRMEVQRGLRSLTEESYDRGSRWPFGQFYLYGAWFFQFVEETYGHDALLNYILFYSRNMIPWRMDSRAQRAFGVSGQQLWQQYQAWLTQRFTAQLHKLKQQGASLYRTLYATPYQNTSLSAADNGELYFIHNDAASTSKVMRLNYKGEAQVLFELSHITGLNWQQGQGLLITRLNVCDNNKLFSDLYRWDPDSHELLRLSHCGRYVRAAWRRDGKGIVAVQLDGPRSRLVLLDNTGHHPETLSEFDAGEAIGEFDMAPDGKSIVASVKRQATGWNIEQLDIARRTWRRLTLNGDLEIRPRYSSDGAAVYFLSDHGHTWNLRRIGIKQGSSIETLSNTLSAIQEAVAMPDGGYAMVEYTAQGLAIVELPVDAPVGHGYAAFSAQPPIVNAISNQAGFRPGRYQQVKAYSAWDTLYPRSWLPSLYLSSDDNSFIGLSLQGADVLGFHRWSLSPLYYSGFNEWGGVASYSLHNRLMFSATRFYSRYAEAGTGNKLQDETQHYQVLAKHYFNSTDSSWYLAAGLADEQLRTTVIQGTGSASDIHNTLTGALLRYDNTELYSRSISEEHGRRVTLTGESYDLAGNSDLSGNTYKLDWNEFFSLGKSHVLKLRAVTAVGDDGISPYRLGGAGDGVSDIGGITELGQRTFALRGYPAGIAQLRGSDMALLTVEWRIPLGLVYDGFFVPPVGLGRHSLAVFVDTGDAWNNTQTAEFKTGAGLEWRVQLLVGYDLASLDLKLGYAHGFDSGGEDRVYLRLNLPF